MTAADLPAGFEIRETTRRGQTEYWLAHGSRLISSSKKREVLIARAHKMSAPA